MTLRTRHLHDDRLLDCYVAARHGEPLDPPVAEHLTDCAGCGGRYAELARVLDRAREDGEADADAIFTPERLRAQQRQIVQRIEHVGRAARVLSFPGRLVHGAISGSSSHSRSRWIAGAAAAGLFLGIALGASYDWQWRSVGLTNASRQAESVRSIGPTPLATRGRGPAPGVAADDAFLSELEVVLDRPGTSELRPLDALTPHVREVRDLR